MEPAESFSILFTRRDNKKVFQFFFFFFFVKFPSLKGLWS
jgi:hypothetical protein